MVKQSIQHVLENSELSPFNDRIWKSFSSDYPSLAPLEDTVWKIWTLSSSLCPSICNSAEGVKHSTVSEQSKAGMIGRRHRASLFFHFEDEIVLWDAACLLGTRTAFFRWILFLHESSGRGTSPWKGSTGVWRLGTLQRAKLSWSGDIRCWNDLL